MCPIILTFLLYVASSHAGETSELPRGHMEPFGGHRPADVPILETTTIPDPWTFWEDYVEPGVPLIMRGAARESPAFELWTEEYLKEHYGDLEIRLEGKNEATSRIPVGAMGLGRDTIESFVDHYQETDAYVISQLPEPMYPEVSVLRCMSCGNMGGRIVEADLWMSSGESVSIMHKDAFNQINCLMQGTKRWKMVHGSYEEFIHPAWEPEREIGGRSSIDVTKVDLIAYPNITKIRWSDFTLNPGDCLFLPKGYYHQVTSHGSTNLAVSLLFSRISTFEDDDCDPVDQPHIPLSEMFVLWSWPGHGVMSMGNLDVWDVQSTYAKIAHSKGVLTKERFLEEILVLFPERVTDKYVQDLLKAWDVIDPKDEGQLTLDEILALDTATMVRHTLQMDLVEQSNTLEFEYFYIDGEDIRDLLFDLLDNFGNVQKEQFIVAYTTHPEYSGTEGFALEVWNKLKTADPNLATREEIEANIEEALENWRAKRIFDLTPANDTSGQSLLWQDEAKVADALQKARETKSKDEL